MKHCILKSLITFLAAAAALVGQSITGAITGAVTDP